MTPEELLAQHPATYKAILDKGIAQGSTEGREAGHKAGIEAGKAEGAKAERERIQGIESLNTVATAKIVSENKFNPEMTKEKVAVVILEEQKKTMDAMAAAIQADGEELGRQAAAIGASQPADKNTAETEIDAAFAKLEAAKKSKK